MNWLKCDGAAAVPPAESSKGKGRRPVKPSSTKPSRWLGEGRKNEEGKRCHSVPKHTVTGAVGEEEKDVR